MKREVSRSPLLAWGIFGAAQAPAQTGHSYGGDRTGAVLISPFIKPGTVADVRLSRKCSFPKLPITPEPNRAPCVK